MTNIFIANLDFDITSDDLKATFSQFGTVSYAHVVYDPKTKRSKGFGYIEMDDTDEAIASINALNGMDVNGRKLDVKIASPKGSRPPKNESKPARPAKREYKHQVKTVRSSTDEKPKRVLRPRRKKN